MEEKESFFLLNADELKNRLAEAGFEKYRAKQVFDAVYKNKIFNPLEIPAIPKKLKEWLSEHFQFFSAKMAGEKQSGDETKKYLFGLSDGNFIECVLLKALRKTGE